MKRSWNSEKNNFVGMGRKKKRKPIISNSDTENVRMSFSSIISRDIMEEIEIAADGTEWMKLQARQSAGRTPVRMIFKCIVGLSGYGKFW